MSDGRAVVGFNGMTPREWAAASRCVWNDLDRVKRTEEQRQHGATFPVELAERLIRFYSKQGDLVLDPFAGVGSTMVAALRAGRNGLGIELNPQFATAAKKWIGPVRRGASVIVGDCVNDLETLVAPGVVNLTVTSPPYADFILKSLKDRKVTHKETLYANSTVRQYSAHMADLGNLPYPDFMERIRRLMESNLRVTADGGYSCWVVKDGRDTGRKSPYISFHSDLAACGEMAGWSHHDLVVWDQSENRRLVCLGYPSVPHTNQNMSFVVVFRKVV